MEQGRCFFHADIDSVFGVWHPAQIEYFHSAACFTVRYRTNRYGARDVERERTADSSRVVVLGDSFVEGYGVERDARFTNVLEHRTERPHLNFGTAGFFGPTQYALLYKHLASRFTHDDVIVAILPLNDFLDDDLTFGKQVLHDRYRPYLQGDYPDYKLVYHQPEMPQTAERKVLDLPAYRLFLHRFTYTYNMLGYMKKLVLYRLAAPPPEDHTTYSGYYDFTEAQFDRMRYALEQIHHQALKMGAEMRVVTLPAYHDFVRFDATGSVPLSMRLSALADSVGFAYLDLLPHMHARANEWASYFHACDPHWNAYGHRVAAEIMVEQLYPEHHP